MKRKILSILSAIFIFVMCGVLSACGDRYKDMEFKIYYAFSEDATEWYDASNGISLNYGGIDDIFQIDENTGVGVGSIYIKVEIENVKEKYIDDIIVTKLGTSGGVNFSSATVRQNEVFKIDITGNTNSSLRFYETNSDKKHDIDLNIYRSLTEIQVDTSIKPAVKVGDIISLMSIKNLYYLPMKNGQTLTNQTGVNYQISGIGYYNDSNQYIEVRNQEYAYQYMTISQEGVLKVNSNYIINANEYIVRVRAISKHNPNIYAEFDVYLVEDQDYIPLVYYSNDSSKQELDNSMTLYKDNEDYSSVELTIDLLDLTGISIYNLPVNSLDSKIQYQICVYVDNKKIDLQELEEINGLLVESLNDDNTLLKITATNDQISINTIKISLELRGLDFSASDAPQYSREITINKTVLPNNISINDELPTLSDLQGSMTGVIYGTSSSSYQGLSLTLLAVPTYANSDVDIYISANENVIISGANVVNSGNNTYRVKSGDTIYVRVKSNVSNDQIITISTQVTPATFENQTVAERFVEIEYTLKKVVTADSIEVYADKELTQLITNRSLYIDARNNTDAYLKVYYSGTTLETSSIKLQSSNNNIKFANNSSTILLNDPTVERTTGLTDYNGTYDLFKISFTSVATIEESIITMTAGDDTVNVQSEFKVYSVYLMQEDSFIVQSSSRNVTTFDDIDNGHFNFAVVKNELVNFEIYGRVQGSLINSQNGIQNLKVEINTEYNSNYGGNYNFSTDAVRFNQLGSTAFSLTGVTGAKTTVLTLTIDFYNKINNIIQLSTRTIYVDIAVYDPISNININISSKEIVYINEYYDEASTTEITFSSYASNYSAASSSVVFSGLNGGEITKVDASQLKVEFNRDLFVDDTIEVYLMNGDNEISINDETILKLDLANILSGKIRVKLTGVSDYESLTLSLTALRFGIESNVSVSTTIVFAEHEAVEGITVSGDNIVQNGLDSYYIYMSFIDVADNGSTSTQFSATPYFQSSEPTGLRFDDLTYELYQVQQDENGNIMLDGDNQAITEKVSNNRLNIAIDSNTNTVTIQAYKNLGGGLFKLVLASMDSYDPTTQSYLTTYTLFVSINDGTMQNKYLLNNAQDLYNINNDLNANYVLRNNIIADSIVVNGETIAVAPIGGENEFNGTLSGTIQNINSNNEIITSRYKITLTVKKTILTTDSNVYAGLFARLGSDAVISDLDIDVNFDTSSFISTAGGSLNIGAIAGLNSGGTIKGVNVTLLGGIDNIIFDSSKITTAINFGGMVGYNNGYINLENCSVSSEAPISIKTNAIVQHNIGMIAGTNINEIFGSYLGKNSLNNVNYSVIANLNVINTSYNLSPTIFMGAVVGQNNGGYIHNIIASGIISVSDENANEIEGFIGGIAGYSSDEVGSTVSVKGIETVAILGMDILGSNSRLAIAGIVGQSENSTINDVRVLASKVEFDKMGITTYGRIVGGGIVAGIVADSNGDEIKNASVESFIANTYDDNENLTNVFYMINSLSNRVAGLVYNSSNTNLSNSFISANIDTNENLISTNKIIYLTSNTNEENVYFLGKINNLDLIKDNILSRDTGSGYYIVYNENSIFDFNSSILQEINISDYFTINYINENNQLYNENTFLNQADVTSENFDTLKDNLYILSEGVFEKVATDAVFDESIKDYYYSFNSEVWNNIRENLYVADIEGYLNLLSDYNFDANTKYYTVEDVNVKNYYILNANGKYIKNEETRIRLNTAYYELSWKTSNNNWENDVLSWIGTDTNSWDLSSERNYISIYEMNFYFPYLVETDSYGNPVYDGEGNKIPLMIERPTEIQASINSDYVIEINSTFIDHDYSIDNYEVTSTTIINYHSDINNPLNNETYNKYNIVNTASIGDMPNGLVNLNVIPSNAQGGVRFEIVRGSAYAYINSQNQIVFTGVSGANPIVVRCYSLFNDELEEYVMFFTQLGISNLILTSNSIYEVEEQGIDYELYTHTGANSTLISINAENIFEGHEFSTILDAGVNNYLHVEAISDSLNSVLNIVNANSINGIMVEVENTEFEGNMVSELIKFTLKLNLTEYFGEEYYPSINGLDQYIDLASANLRVVVYKTATNVEIEGGDYSVFTNANIDFNVNLYTGYVSGETSSNYVKYHTIGNTIILDEINKDSISLLMEVESNEQELNNLLNRAGVKNIADLFDFDFSYSLLNSDLKDVLGYKYSIGLSLKDEFNFRYITSSIELKLTVYSSNNTIIQDSILITFNPTKLSTVRIENYTATNVTNITNYTSLIKSNTTETSVISPGGYGGVMMIYLEPSYSNIISASLTSTSLYVPSLGRNVSIIFEQLVKNENGEYETVYPNNETIDGGINLRLVSSVDSDGNYNYDGIIYIHTQMDKFVGMSGTVDVILNVETGINTNIEQKRTLITEYLPGATLSYDGLGISSDEYLIQKDTYNNEVKIQIYGYQFNSNPDISFIWKLNDGDTQYSYDKTEALNLDESSFEERKLSLYTFNGTTYISCNEDDIYDSNKTYYEDNRNVIIDKNGERYNILNYLSYRFKDDYNQVEENEDGSYTMTILLNVSADIPAGFEMTATLTLATSESLITSDQEDSLIFYPVDYIVNSVSSTNLANGNLNIAYNRTSSINLHFSTNNPNNDLSEDIYNKMIDDISAINLSRLFSYVNENGEIVQFSDSEELHPEFIVNILNRKLTITGQDAFYRKIEFSVHYGYVLENGQYVLKFGTMSENSLNKTLQFSFILNIYADTTEENAIPIYSVDDIFDPDTGTCLLGEDADYILMNDIVIDNFVPIDVDIASFDGNNKVIKIRSFAVGVDRREYGLFANIGSYQDINGEIQTTILKNVIVDYSEFSSSLDLTNNNITNVTFGGLVANNNGGLIYNCDVLNLGNTTKTINILLDNSNNVNVVFGGLVGNNSGIITNSRVGRLGYTKIIADENSESSVQVSGSAINFVIGNASISSGQGFVATTAGFVGYNSGIIATSYVANMGLVNYSTAPEGIGSNYSMTAGFVGENTGTISYSYVKALESTISETNPYSTGLEIQSPTNGNVAGFVYLNSGNINNSFANTVLTSKSAYVAGFVYNNQINGVISESYAACTLNGIDTANDASEQPFVGVNNSDELLSYGTLENVYYLIDSNNSLIVKTETGKDQAIGLNEDNFTNSNSLNGFVFINSNSRTERNQGVWSYYNQNNSYRILPELTNANQISHSYRYLVRQEDSNYIYNNAASYEIGTANNPYIIRNVEEFNSIMLSNGTDNSMAGYVRFINNIDFASDETAIQTRVNFTLGDENNNSITSIEGNGMTISGIYLDVGNSKENYIGLFARIENAYIKNLNLEFASTSETDGQFSSLSAIYSGGLAGTINNSVIINIDLNGPSTTISGQNFAGGLAGLITGNSLIYGINSNLSVKAVNTDSHYYMYYNEDEFNSMKAYGAINYSGNYDTYLTQLSFAGGIAGVIDIVEREYEEFNLSYINIYGNEMYDKTNIDANILADYAGGIAGYAGSGTESLRLKYYTGNTNLIRGQFAVGGIFAVSSGNITASQVTAEEDEQYSYDTTLGKYILDLEDGKDADLDIANAGNLNLLETYKYGGGLIGISINSNINSSYSKVGFKVGRTVGGLVGVAVGANVVYSYAIPYVNIDNTYLEKAGGLIGSAYGVTSGNVDRNQEVSEYTSYLTYILGETNKTTDIQFTFSTLLLDKDKILTQNINTNKYINFDYVCADYGQSESDTTGFLTSNKGSSLLYVYAGKVAEYDNIVVDGESIVKHSNSIRANEEYISLLYDLSEDNIEQVSTFNNIFSGWSTTYWTLNADRYFPLLLNENVENYIEISNPDDFYQLINNPSGSFMIVDDIDMTDWCTNLNSNYIFDIEFTGILIGQKEDGSIPVLSNLFLNAQNSGNAGFFRQTTKATIRNITIEWGENPNINNENENGVAGSVILQNTIDTFGGVSSIDNGSLLSNLTVRVVSPSDDSNISLFNSNNGTIAGFGGIVGNAMDSNILNCTFSGRVDVELSSTTSQSNIVFGGLVGESDKTDILDLEESNMSIMNSNVGLNTDGRKPDEEKTIFNLTISKGTNSYIGGAVGYSNNTAISSISIGHYSYETDYKRITFNVKLNNSTTNNYVGGLVGGLSNSQLSSADAITSINISGSQNIPDGTTDYINSFAGLVGYYSMAGSTNDSLSINNVNTSSNINILDGTNINNLFVSTGIGYAHSSNSTELKIKQALFTGTINSETASDSIGGITYISCTLNQVHASGAVAYATENSNIVLKEVMSTADIIIGSDSSTTSLYAGGLIGKANVVSATDVASTGKIVPITNYNSDDSKNNFYIGGFIGYANNATITNAYTLTSIISDSLTHSSIQALNMNALIGGISDKGSINTKYVYYSSDYSLCAESSGTGYNLTAYTLTRSNIWRTSSQNGLNASQGYWSEINSGAGTYYLPYISSLSDDLINYGVMKKEGTITTYLISSLAPTLIENASNMNILQTEGKGTFTYYILSNNITDELYFTNVSGVTNGVLNGILIGGEREYLISTSKLSNYTNTQGELFTGVIANVGKHSAISNLHIKFESDVQYNFSGITGIIAGYNQGVISNSSVQGTGVKIESNYLGLITGRNAGMIAYSYSSAEIVDVSGAIAGITYQNQGMILSCYFTGYINNSNSQTPAAGLIIQNIRVTGENSYLSNFVYNSYMAGVIESIADGGNSFIAQPEGMLGKNNYIDSLANIETVNLISTSGDTSTQILRTVSTEELMSASVLTGSWYYTARKINNNYYLIDRNSDIYGYNYLYPTYKINKISSDSATDWSNPNNYVDNQYQIYSGTGIINTSQGESYDDIINLISSEEAVISNNLKQNIMRIPHLGVLSAIQSLTMDYGEDITQPLSGANTDLYYVLIYDIDGRGKSNTSLSWQSIGSSRDNAENNKFYNGSLASFTGMFISNKYFDFSDLTLNNACQISGLDSGVFANIKNGYFGFLKLGGGQETLSNTNSIGSEYGSGLLGVNINSTNEEAFTGNNVVVNKIQFVQNTEILANGVVGGLFGTVESGNILVKDLVSYYIDDALTTRPSITISEGSRAGLIAGNAESGIINLDFTENGLAMEENLNATNDSWYIKFDGSNIAFAGGLFGQINNKTININATINNIDSSENNKINIYVGEDGVQSLGGIVGLITGSTATATISNLTVLLKQTSIEGMAQPLNVKVLGGLVSNLGSGIDNVNSSNVSFVNCGIDLQSGLNISSIVDNQANVGNYFGLLSAKILGGNLDVQNFYLANNESVAITYECTSTGNDEGSYYISERENSQGAGMLVGYQANANFTFDYVDDIDFPTLHFINGYNLGGIVGAYESGSIGILKGDKEFNVQLYGTSNVGGAVGLVKENGLADISEIVMKGDNYWNFITNETPFATLYSLDSASGYENSYNWGGLFGYYKKANLKYSIQQEDGDEFIEKTLTIVNANMIEVGTTTDKIKNIYNIGGIAGKISSNTIIADNLKNIGYIGAEREISNSWGLSNDNEYLLNIQSNMAINNTIRMVNVGGIIGYVNGLDDKIQISNISNDTNEEIIGYQNVGGLVGYAGDKVNINNTIEYVSINDTEIVIGNKYYKNIGTTDSPKYELIIAQEGETNLYQLSSASIASTGRVIGVLNVGGAIGYFAGESLKNIWSEANIYGNASVGGLIGYTTNSQSYIYNNIVASQNNDLEIKGIYLAITKSYIDSGAKQIGYEYYIPTSVGGLIGTAEKGILEDNKIYNIVIKSTEEGEISNAVEQSNNVVVSTISNNMYNLQFSGGTSNPKDPDEAFEYYSYTDRGEYENNATVKFDELESGFGGFIGSATSDVAFAVNEDDNIVIESNTIQVDIEAQMGVNVGAYYGTYYSYNTETINGIVTNILTPTLFGDVSINGGYNIGSIIGYYSGENLSQYSLSEATGNGTISLQNKYSGMYVGGLFGKLKSNEVDSFDLSNNTNVKVSLNVQNSYYAGGLVGRLEVTQDSSFKGSITADIINENIDEETISSRFGGLLGMLKVAKNSYNSGFDVRVEGEHEYAFTINTIENANYHDGSTMYSVTEDTDTSVTLTALASYVNLDMFKISPTSNSNYYEVKNEGENKVVPNNPLRRDDSWGWAIDYTMFKSMRRCISIEDNNGAAWDSISTIYDASNITYVATIENLELTNTPLSGSSEKFETDKSNAEGKGLEIVNDIIQKPKSTDENYEEKLSIYNSLDIIGKVEENDEEKYIFNPNYICYTIYEEAEGKERLYSAIGIADIYYDLNGDYGIPEDNSDGDTAGDVITWIGAVLFGGDAPTSYYNLVLNGDKEDKGLTYLNYKKSYKTVDGKDGETVGFWPSDSSARDYYCAINNFYQNADEGRKLVEEETYFLFTYFYDNATLSTGTETGDDANIADSGSIFEANGVKTNLYNTKYQNEQEEPTYPWLEPVQKIVAALEIASLFIGGGALLTAKIGKSVVKKTVSTVIKTVGKVVATGAKALAKSPAFTVLLSTLIGTIISMQLDAANQADNIYLNIENSSIGFMSESYKTEVVYENNLFKSQSDDSISVNGINYIYYSSSRPNDYYAKRYYIYVPKNNATGDNTTQEYDTFNVSTISSTEVIETSGMFEGAYVCEYEGKQAYAYDYYIYNNGAYYVILDAIEISVLPFQLSIDSSLVEYSDYLNMYGNYYVRGKYVNGTYTYNQNTGGDRGNINNYVEYKDNAYYVNNNEWSQSSLKDTSPTVNINLNYTINKSFTKNDENDFIKITDAGENIFMFEGYAFMQGAYYTADGIDLDNAAKKVGIFTCVGEDEANVEGLTFGVDYVTRTYNETKTDEDGYTTTIPHTYYYKISSIEDDSLGIDFGLAGSTTGTVSTKPEIGDAIDVKLYPKSFSNPYASEISDSHPSVILDSQDELIYTTSGTQGEGISHQVTYYYYEGGYLKRDIQIDKETVSYAYGKINLEEEDLTSNQIFVFTEDGKMEEQKYSITNLIDYLKGNETGLYTEDVSQYEEGDINREIKKLENQYYYDEDNKVLYKIYEDIQLIDGNLSKVTYSTPGSENKNQNYNKYLANYNTQFYTRYKYTDLYKFNSENNWESNNAYYIYLEDMSEPNIGKTTYLVESCRVFLSGNVYIDINNNSITAGSISVSY